MTEPNEHVDAASEKLTDGEMVERVAHPTHDTAGNTGATDEDRGDSPSPTPER